MLLAVLQHDLYQPLSIINREITCSIMSNHTITLLIKKKEGLNYEAYFKMALA